MALAFLVLSSGVVLVWSSLSGKPVWESVQSVLRGNTLDTSLSHGASAPPALKHTSVKTASGSLSFPSAPSTSGLDPSGHSIADLKAYARALLAQRGWSDQWDSFDTLVNKESGWLWDARNPGQRGYAGEEHAYGIPQALPPSKMASAGSDWKTNGYTQLRWMVSYIATNRNFHDPDSALAFHRRMNWY